MSDSWIIPDWPAPPGVRALSTQRTGGCSRGPYRSFNLGAHCGDDPASVQRNRRRLREALPAEPRWLRQVHGTDVWTDRDDERQVRDNASIAPASTGGLPVDPGPFPAADARVTGRAGVVCAVLTADCLPVLLCSQAGDEVAAAHAGWRGLSAGVLERTVAAMRSDPGSLMAWLGPAIGPARYEVGRDVVRAFAAHESGGAGAILASGDRWRLDLYTMARHCLRRAGVTAVSGGEWCTFDQPERFFSYRRDGVCGRMASLVWLEAPDQSREVPLSARV
ncbi:peptidoglycan editing factor PgeF [Elongatibacter sediminis]|uniref:Purine nucleoside phosphorylase n=1 Tax=Elongatibacter sediminis TaxID=3119006 RepID=A0AAW9R9A7_9GAMM